MINRATSIGESKLAGASITANALERYHEELPLAPSLNDGEGLNHLNTDGIHAINKAGTNYQICNLSEHEIFSVFKIV